MRYPLMIGILVVAIVPAYAEVVTIPGQPSALPSTAYPPSNAAPAPGGLQGATVAQASNGQFGNGNAQMAAPNPSSPESLPVPRKHRL
jgi:hypothetical protein